MQLPLDGGVHSFGGVLIYIGQPNFQFIQGYLNFIIIANYLRQYCKVMDETLLNFHNSLKSDIKMNGITAHLSPTCRRTSYYCLLQLS
jgi:hypothetical protein